MYKLPGILGVICQGITLGQWNQLEIFTSLKICILVLKFFVALVFLIIRLFAYMTRDDGFFM